LIVADIDKGGVLASLVGTVALLSSSERCRVKGLIINKFRGDLALLYDGLRIIEEKTAVPVLGVLPHAGNLEIPEEDGAGLRAGPHRDTERAIRVGVVVLPRISNYTDFEPFLHEPDVSLQYFEDPRQAGALELLCLPGTKSTIADLEWMRARGWDRFIARHCAAGNFTVGICGGYQMMGRRIDDPNHIESDLATVTGLGMLDVATTFEGDKITVRTEAAALGSGLTVSGYEIHCGRITRLGADAAFRVLEPHNISGDRLEGALADQGRTLGTSIHGLFDAPHFRREFLNQIRRHKGLDPIEEAAGEEALAVRSAAYDRFARLLRENLDISVIASLAGIDAALLR
jgi:adenosylcobyric acid synthase